MTPTRNLHIECNPNETPLNAIRRSLKNMKLGETASIEGLTLPSGQTIPPDMVQDLVDMASNKRVYLTWIEETPWQVKVHVLYADDVDQEDYEYG